MSSGDRLHTPHLRIALTGTYGFDDTERILLDLDPLARLGEPVTLELDLTDLVGLSAPAAAWLTAAVRRAQLLDLVLHSAIIDGNDQRPVDAGAPSAREWRVAEPFHGLKDLRRLVPALTDALADRIGVGRTAADSLRICLDELAENVDLHSGAFNSGTIALRHRDGDDTFEACVADLGVGIRTSLGRNPAYAGLDDDVSAVIEALEPTVTGTPERNGGFGLSVARSFVQTNNAASLRLRSGHAVVNIDGTGQYAAAAPLHVPGTLVALRLGTDGDLSVKRAYDVLDDDFERRLRERGLADQDGASASDLGRPCSSIGGAASRRSRRAPVRRDRAGAGARSVTVVSLAVATSRRRDGALTLTRPIERPCRLVGCAETPPARTIAVRGRADLPIT